MEGIAARLPGSRFTAFTTVPGWFFADSLASGVPLRLESVDVDPGLVQEDALTEDLPATVGELRGRIPFQADVVASLARRVERLRGDAVVCDIAPLGLAVARACGRPSVLIENFTWDWIYRGYLGEHPELAGVADYLSDCFAGADHHVQAEPVCARVPEATLVAPVSRRSRTEPSTVRARLGVPARDTLVVVTMGGVGWSPDRLALRAPGPRSPWVVLPGHPGGHHVDRERRVIRLPSRSEVFHPDLVRAADVVVGKLGYSTVAEVWSAGTRLAFVERPRFRESSVLAGWVRRELSCHRLDPADLETGEWLDVVDELVEHPVRSPPARSGVGDIVQVLARVVGRD